MCHHRASTRSGDSDCYPAEHMAVSLRVASGSAPVGSCRVARGIPLRVAMGGSISMGGEARLYGSRAASLSYPPARSA